MNEKISLYEEILEQDPSANIFYPLARMHSQAGDTDKALEVLQRGLASHPDHLEGQCLLIELLDGAGREAEAQKAAGRLADKLKKHPGFWKNWSKLCDKDKDPDLALAITFIATVSEGKSLTWSKVVQEGLKSLGVRADQ